MFEEEEILSRFNLPSEQRQELRVPLHKPALVEIKKGEAASYYVECMLMDLSVGGGKVILSEELPDLNNQDEISVKFELGESFILRAIIVWRERIDGHEKYGLSWMQMDEGIKDRLFQGIKQIYFSTRQSFQHLWHMEDC